MVSNAGVKIKVMPDSPDSNLDEIELQIKDIIEEKSGKVSKMEKESIAFGLKAIIVMFTIIETFQQDPLLDELRNIDHVSSAEIIDFRRIGF